MQKLTKEHIEERLKNDVDFIDSPRYNYSIGVLLKKHPEGVENTVIAKALHMTADEVEEAYLSAVKKLQKIMKVGKCDENQCGPADGADD